MISICCTPLEPDYKEFTPDERRIFCKVVYLLRKRGYSIREAQRVAYLKVLKDGMPFELV
ncbi:MAG TPA: hypothetical protein PLI53_03940 [Geobacteraceae bacterium]|nr:hypothetical protein [Geobacteraceae bacterium]